MVTGAACPCCGEKLEAEPVAGAEGVSVCRACGSALAFKGEAYTRLTQRDLGRLSSVARNRVSLIVTALRLKGKLN